MPRYTYGGQALIEGVLMRGRDAIAVALRHPDGRIVWASERLDSGFHGTRWSKLPFVRGLVVLYETLIVGTRWLVRSAGVAASQEGVDFGRGPIALMLGMTLHALEAGDPLVPSEIRKYPTAHPRCGTEFLVVVIALSIFAFALVGRQNPVVMVGSRIILIPVIAAVGYEILKFGAKYRSNPLVRAVMYPGILVQKITTRQPTGDMIEVAIVSMEQALKADGEALPAGSGSLPRDLMRLPGAVPGAIPAPEGAAAGTSAEAEVAAPVT